MSYESPITQIMSDMKYQYEEDCVKVVQSYGFDIDKEELTKALLYDRNQYEKGYQQGRADAIDLIGRHMWNYSQEVWEDFKPILENLKENKNIEKCDLCKYEKQIESIKAIIQESEKMMWHSSKTLEKIREQLKEKN